MKVVLWAAIVGSIFLSLFGALNAGVLAANLLFAERRPGPAPVVVRVTRAAMFLPMALLLPLGIYFIILLARALKSLPNK